MLENTNFSLHLLKLAVLFRMSGFKFIHSEFFMKANRSDFVLQGYISGSEKYFCNFDR